MMSKTCKIKPSAGECAMCLDSADVLGGTLDCSKCGYKKRRYELVGFTSGIFNDYALVKVGNRIEKAYLHNVYDIREE